MRLLFVIIGCGVCACSKAPPAHRQLRSAAAQDTAAPAQAAASAQVASAPTPCQPAPDTDPQNLLDNFEDGDSELMPVAGRNGAWFVANDLTPGASIHPAAGPANPERLEVPRCSSLFALHFIGDGFVS